METQNKPIRVKPPTRKEVLVDVDVVYRSYKETQDRYVTFDKDESKSFVNAIHEHRKKFIPEVELLKIAITDKGFEFQIKIHDIINIDKTIRAWDFYQTHPILVEKKIVENLKTIYGDVEILDLQFEKGSLVVTFTIVVIGIVIGLVAGTITAATGAICALFIIYSQLKEEPGIKNAIDKIDENVLNVASKFIVETVDKIKNIFGKFFGDFGMGFEPV